MQICYNLYTKYWTFTILSKQLTYLFHALNSVNIGKTMRFQQIVENSNTKCCILLPIVPHWYRRRAILQNRFCAFVMGFCWMEKLVKMVSSFKHNRFRFKFLGWKLNHLFLKYYVGSRIKNSLTTPMYTIFTMKNLVVSAIGFTKVIFL